MSKGATTSHAQAHSLIALRPREEETIVVFPDLFVNVNDLIPMTALDPVEDEDKWLSLQPKPIKDLTKEP